MSERNYTSIHNSSPSPSWIKADPEKIRIKAQKLARDYSLVVDEEDPDWPEDAEGQGFKLHQFFDKITIKNVKKHDNDDEEYDSENEIVWKDDNYIQAVRDIASSDWEDTVFKDFNPLVILVHHRYRRVLGSNSSTEMGNLDVWDGTISQNDFYVAARVLVERWKQVDPSLPQWTWIPCKAILMGSSCKEEGYLSLENMYHLDPNEECISVESFSNREETDDEATLVHCSNNTKYFYDIHIVYSFSYRVPVLYFRGYRSDGQPMNLDDIENELPCSSSRLLRESKWTYMTQEEHPYLHRPWFTLHPCATRDWLKLLLVGTSMKDFDISHYLPSWLSVVGQAVGLRIPLELQQRSLEHQSVSSVMNN